MIAVSLKGLWGRKLRTLLTALAIILGVAMISGTYVLTDSITAAFTNIVDDSFTNADAVISGKVAFKNDDSNTGEGVVPAFPASVLTKVKQLPDVAAAS
jgi:putative ABC transport system permease protein